MSSMNIDEISSVQSIDTFAPVAVYRLKFYQPESLFDNVLYALIRPPRFVYNQRLLIPGRRYHQKFDYQVHNIPFPLSIYWAENPKYIILYLHGNSSSRYEGYLHLKQLPEGACLACFDFKACGLRKDGKYITLGKQQSIEVDTAVQYLKAYGYPIVGWGRSMGAVSLLMSSKCQIMIADSPFCSLYDLCKETSLNFIPTGLCCLVHCLFPCLFCCVRSGVEKKSGMDPSDLQIIKAVQKQCSTKSILLLAGTSDTMIHYSHAERLHNAFPGKDKRLILFEGTHNSNRPEQIFEEIFNFINSSIEKRQTSKSKIVKPLQYQTSCKVFKLDKSFLNKPQISHPTTIEIGQNKQFESSNQALLPPIKATIELKSLKILPIKSSPKKLSRIEGDIEINEEADIQIHHEQDIIREGIGKFEKDLCRPQGQTFKSISIKNQVQSSSNKGIQLKSIRPISDKNAGNTKEGVQIEIKTISVNKQSTQQTYFTDNGSQARKNLKSNEKLVPSIKVEIQNDKITNKNPETKNKDTINIEQSITKKDKPDLREIKTPSSQPSSLQYEDVKLVQEQNTLKDDNFQNQSLESRSKTSVKQDVECKVNLLQKSHIPQQTDKNMEIENQSPSIKGLQSPSTTKGLVLSKNKQQLQYIHL